MAMRTLCISAKRDWPTSTKPFGCSETAIPLQICLQPFAPAPFPLPFHRRQPQCQRGSAIPKFACSHLHLCRFPNRSTSANLNTDRAPPSPNLLADICTCGVFPAASPQPTSIPTGYRHPQICLQTFAPVPFSQPLHLRQPQYRWGTAYPPSYA